MAGYHLNPVPKGIPGEASKIFEEVHEFCDALIQKNEIMALLELSDLIGAIELYVEERYRGTITLNDLLAMKDATKRAFESGARP